MKTNLIHFAVGLAIGLVMFLLTGVNFISIFIAACVGVGVELYQFYGKHEGPMMADRIFDVIGYAAGAFIMSLIIRGVI